MDPVKKGQGLGKTPFGNAACIAAGYTTDTNAGLRACGHRYDVNTAAVAGDVNQAWRHLREILWKIIPHNKALRPKGIQGLCNRLNTWIRGNLKIKLFAKKALDVWVERLGCQYPGFLHLKALPATTETRVYLGSTPVSRMTERHFAVSVFIKL